MKSETSTVEKQPVEIIAFYYFCDLKGRTEQVEAFLNEKASELDIHGLIILAEEGLNMTVCGAQGQTATFVATVAEALKCEKPEWKTSFSEKLPFRRFKIKIRSEIVTAGIPELQPDCLDDSHMTPEEWDKCLKTEDNIYLVDTRNWYETEMGTFKNAITPPIDEFTEFSQFMEKQNLPKDQKILMFCTGGIRCEKGILDLRQKGYTNVHQLQGGILNYLQHFPDQEFDGECFVFDHRVAVQQDLSPSEKYGLCPHCGQPAEQTVDCSRCDRPEKICQNCISKNDEASVTCSKHCAYMWEKHPGRKGPGQDLNAMREKSQKKSHGKESEVRC